MNNISAFKNTEGMYPTFEIAILELLASKNIDGVLEYVKDVIFEANTEGYNQGYSVGHQTMKHETASQAELTTMHLERYSEELGLYSTITIEKLIKSHRELRRMNQDNMKERNECYKTALDNYTKFLHSSQTIEIGQLLDMTLEEIVELYNYKIKGEFHGGTRIN
jgi:hypothetical protein